MDVRIIAVTNKNLQELMPRVLFRDYLYCRIVAGKPVYTWPGFIGHKYRSLSIEFVYNLIGGIVSIRFPDMEYC